ncbi:fibrous sheath-interacting protein 1 isoform X2 [Scleropages formosus]|uniref:Fibrous sheath-interacting protein 1 n=1 Tax=Scleropages formosus TaxID=113540 RepID=A0A8C9VSJ8_SCLFO|nr:fibrous sheath-interacting protein 1 isoform X2 [Scleropages formosus]
MDITRGSLDDISRPASSERSRAGSRVSSLSAQERVRCGQDSLGLLIVLSPETEPREQRGTLEEELCSAMDGSAGELMSRGSVEDGGHVSHSDGTIGGMTVQVEPVSFTRKVPLSERDCGDVTVPKKSGSPADSEDLLEGSDMGVSQADGSDEESEDSELQKAIKKMRELDEILALKISKEKELKKKGKKLHQKLLEELQELKTKQAAARADETENTRLFLALESASSHRPSEDEAFAPVFGTQVPDIQFDREVKHWDEGEKSQRNSTDSNRLIQDETTVGPSNGRHGLDRSKRKQDFVRKNIDLAREAGSQVLMTEGEKLRLAELLQDLDDNDDSDPTGDEEESLVLAVHRCAGGGYTPEPAELTRLRHIDSRLQLLLPVESFLSVRSSNLNHTLVQGPEAGQSSGRTWLPGEKVLQDTWEMRGQQARLREIEDQLERMGRDQNLDCAAGRCTLSGEQLRALLEDCMVALSDRSGHWDVEGVMFSQDGPDDPGSPDLLPGGTLQLSATLLSELMGDAIQGGGAS